MSTKPNFTSTRNACKLCSPLGASVVYRGIEGCLPLIHGGQGCSTYIRRYIISHFREPIDIASSNFTESSAVFGGENNLHDALDNVIRQYHPASIGIATTCLAETIGEDIRMYLSAYREKREDLPVIFHASTPSYRGTHTDGFLEALRSVVKAFAVGGAPTRRVNILSGFLSAEDLRHLHETARAYTDDYTLIPDYSDTLDGGSWEEYQKMPEGGTPVAKIAAMGRAAGSIELGCARITGGTAGDYLAESFGVKNDRIDFPIGIVNTDRFHALLSSITGTEMPEAFRKERGRLVDSYIDGHKYLFGRKVIIYGDEDFVVAMAGFLDETGLVPVLATTGAYHTAFAERVDAALTTNRGRIQAAEDTDFASLLERAKDAGAEMVIGNSKGFYLAKNLGIPLVRCGFPVHDRIGGQRILHVGYRGTQNLYDRIVNAFLEVKQGSSRIGYSYL